MKKVFKEIIGFVSIWGLFLVVLFLLPRKPITKEVTLTDETYKQLMNQAPTFVHTFTLNVFYALIPTLILLAIYIFIKMIAKVVRRKPAQ